MFDQYKIRLMLLKHYQCAIDFSDVNQTIKINSFVYILRHINKNTKEFKTFGRNSLKILQVTEQAKKN